MRELYDFACWLAHIAFVLMAVAVMAVVVCMCYCACRYFIT